MTGVFGAREKEFLEFERAVQLISERDAGEKGGIGHAQERKGLERPPSVPACA